MSNNIDIKRKYFIISYIIYLISGQIKSLLLIMNIHFHLDFTIFSLLNLAVFSLLFSKGIKLGIFYRLYPIVFFIVTFIIFYSLSSIYTFSTSYYLVKLVKLFTLIPAIFFPLVFAIYFERKSVFEYFFKYFPIFVYMYSSLYYYYLNSYLHGILYTHLSSDKLESFLGNYLEVGLFNGLIFLYFYIRFLKEGKLYNLFHAMISFSFVIMSAARGPLVFSIIVAIFYILFFWIKNFKNIKIFMQVFLVFFSSFLIIILLYIIYPDIFMRIIDRFSVIFTQNEGGASISERIHMIKFTLEKINLRIFWGYGLGSFGLLYTGTDKREYPHNIFLEVWFEGGIFSLIFLFLYFLSSFFLLRKKIDVLLLNMFLIANLLKSYSIIDTRFFEGMLILSLLEVLFYERKKYKSCSYFNRSSSF